MNVYMMIATAPISDTAKAKLMLVASSYSSMIEAAYAAGSPALLEQLATQVPDPQAGQNVTVSGGSHVVVNFGKMVQKGSGRSSGNSKPSTQKASTVKVSEPARADGDRTLVKDTWINQVFAPLLGAKQSCQVDDSLGNARVVSSFGNAVKRKLQLKAPLKMALFYPAGTAFTVPDGYESVSTTRLKDVTSPEGFWLFKSVAYKKAIYVRLIEAKASEPKDNSEAQVEPVSDTAVGADSNVSTLDDEIQIDLGDLWNDS
jgi:hypothetical protein